MASSADRNLLFGILAVQLDFIGQDALVAGMNAWLLDKQKPLGEILRDQGRLSNERLQLLTALVAEHLRQHDNDPEKSIAALSSIESTLKQKLANLPDQEVHGTVMQIGAARTEKQLSDPAATIDQPFEAPPPAGRYRILKPHARGGLGEVYVAEDTELGRKVALKEIQRQHAGDSSSRSRFVLEAEITGGLEHPGIVPVYGLGTYADGRPYYAMRFIKGDNLSEAIKRFHGGVPNFDSLQFRQLLQRFIDVCNAVAYAHSRGVLHRDLKPGNIMLGKYGETLVVDWGLAKLAGSPQREQGTHDETVLSPQSSGDSSATVAGRAMGTPAYMPPEQAAGEWDKLGPASDVYSLGATLYELLTGQKPFESRLVEVVLEDVRAGRFVPPNRVLASVPAALNAVCMRALALNPANRYATPLELAKEVEGWLADEPVSAFGEPFSFRARRWVRKHSRLTTGLAATLMVGAIGLGALAWQRERARKAIENEQLETAKERDRANSQRDIAVEQRRRTREALDTMVSNEMIERLGSQKELSAGQRDFLQKALEYYREFAAEAGTEAEGGKLVAAANFRVAYLLSALGQRSEAATAYRSALTILEKLAADFPTAPEHRHRLAVSHNNLALQLRELGQRQEAETSHRAALAIMDKLVVDFPAVPEYRQELARSHNNLGILLADLGQGPGAEKSYGAAFAIYDKLAADFPTVAVYRQELAWGHNNLANQLDAIGRWAEAEKSRRAAMVILDKLSADFPAVPRYRQDLANTYNNLADRLDYLGQRPEAEKLYRAALTILDKLAIEFPAVPAYRHYLARSNHNLADLLDDLGQRAEAEKLYRVALAIREKLAADFPAVPVYRQQLAWSHNNLAVLLRALGKRAEAEKAYRVALAIREKLAAELPAVLQYAVDLGASYCNLGNLVGGRGEAELALEWHTKAIGVLAPVVAHEPQLVTSRQYLAKSHWGRAEDFVQLNRFAEALADWDAAVKLDDGSERLAIRGHRTVCLAHLGRAADAAREASEIAVDPAVTDGALYKCACGLSVASASPDNPEAEAHAARAVELLRHAVVKGYRDFSHVLSDPDLAAIRSRPDFADLFWQWADVPAAEKKP